MLIDSEIFLVGVLEGDLHLVMSAYLSDRTGRTIGAALTAMQSRCKEYNWNVVFQMDSEPGGKSVVDKLLFKDVVLDISPSGKKLSVFYRMIRTIKERFRAVRNSLPYNLPKFFIKHAVAAITIAINSLRNDSSSIPSGDLRSARERFTGQRTDVRKAFPIPFGQYAEVWNTNNRFINSSNPRTQGAIALGTTGDVSSSVLFWMLSTNRLVRRAKGYWKEMPINQDTVDFINREAIRRGSVAADPAVDEADDQEVDDEDALSDQDPELEKPVHSKNYRSGEMDERVEDISITKADGEILDADQDSETIVEENHEPEAIDAAQVAGVHIEPLPATEPEPAEQATRYGRVPKKLKVPSKFVEGYHIRINDALNRLGRPAMKAIVTELQNVMKYKVVSTRRS
jgi:hypothetical protein